MSGNGGGRPGEGYASRAGDAVATPIAPSDIEVRAQVTVTVEIK